MVSKAQYASLVSAILVSRPLLAHLITRWRGVFSSNGGLGKLCTFNLGFVDIMFCGLNDWYRTTTTMMAMAAMRNSVKNIGR